MSISEGINCFLFLIVRLLLQLHSLLWICTVFIVRFHQTLIKTWTFDFLYHVFIPLYDIFRFFFIRVLYYHHFFSQIIIPKRAIVCVDNPSHISVLYSLGKILPLFHLFTLEIHQIEFNLNFLRLPLYSPINQFAKLLQTLSIIYVNILNRNWENKV